RRSSLRRRLLWQFEFRFKIGRATWREGLGVILLPCHSLGNEMFRIGAPGAQSFLVLELDDGAALTVFRVKALVRDIARHGAGEFAHTIDGGGVFVAKARFQARAKNGNEHRLRVLFEIMTREEPRA